MKEFEEMKKCFDEFMAKAEQTLVRMKGTAPKQNNGKIAIKCAFCKKRFNPKIDGEVLCDKCSYKMYSFVKPEKYCGYGVIAVITKMANNEIAKEMIKNGENKL